MEPPPVHERRAKPDEVAASARQNIAGLAGVGDEIVECESRGGDVQDELEATVGDAAQRALRAPLVSRLRRWPTVDEAAEAATLEGRGRRDSKVVEHGGQDVEVLNRRVDPSRLDSGDPEEERHADAGLEQRVAVLDAAVL